MDFVKIKIKMRKVEINFNNKICLKINKVDILEDLCFHKKTESIHEEWSVSGIIS